MRAFRSATIGVTVLAMAAAGLVVLTPPATAAPCGNAGSSGSSLLPDFGSSSGSSGFGSSGPGSSGGGNRGPQGRLPVIVGGNTKTVAWVTGPGSQNDTLDRFGISGTDLGIMWDNGSGQTLMAVGDTFGDCDAGGQEWRHNVLLRSDDNDLADGITVPDAVPGDISSGSIVTAERPRFSQEIIHSLGIPDIEVTDIPTAAISIGGVQYINYMSVRSWGDPGRWVTNFSAVAVSHNNGQTWETDISTIRVNADITLPGVEQVNPDNSKFQMNAYVAGKDGYIYQFGTPNGRFGAASLTRFNPADILDLTKYEYYTNNAANRWSTEFGDLKAVIPQPVSEMSVAWSDYLQRYIILYGNELEGRMVIRTAEHPEGPWSSAKTLFTSLQLGGGMYAPYVHPKSIGRDLYFTASRWADYNVMLLRTDLDQI
ncbi:DUF4185 domain-containing protein [Williamsia sp.]|uniref:DUF4185 domain-containing protein n=1 Tax=Williamsia sp. TaxID=1872085 RepID=UPI002F9489FD